ncbi:nicotinamide-nucleotide amidase [Porticoccus sp. GXU_MW_L64]
MNSAVIDLAEQLGSRLLDKGWQATCAESCTGGGVAQAITAVAGSSRWFEAGFVTYSNGIKQQLLGVSEGTLNEQGAVSEAVVKEMAAGALRVSGAQLAVAVSGIAGPDGGTAQKPVGTVWFAWLSQGGQCVCRCCCFSGDRGQVRQQAVEYALQGLLELL